jgi:hypothetical protein
LKSCHSAKSIGVGIGVGGASGIYTHDIRDVCLMAKRRLALLILAMAASLSCVLSSTEACGT